MSAAASDSVLEQDDQPIVSPTWRLALVVAGGVVVVWLSANIWTWRKFGLSAHDAFGDISNVLDSLFSGLAFVGVISAIVLQRAELQLQRRELFLTRDELAGQKKALQAQNLTLVRQSFENTFFQLLRLQGSIVAQMDIRTHGTIIQQGRDCFRTFCERLSEFFEEPNADHLSELKQIEAAYERLYRERQADIGHYFRSLFNLISFVDQSEMQNKAFYANLIRAQLSGFELVLLFYNCIANVGDKFNPLAEKYGLLKDVPIDRLISKAHTKFHAPKAFGR